MTHEDRPATRFIGPPASRRTSRERRHSTIARDPQPDLRAQQRVRAAVACLNRSVAVATMTDLRTCSPSRTLSARRAAVPPTSSDQCDDDALRHVHGRCRHRPCRWPSCSPRGRSATEASPPGRPRATTSKYGDACFAASAAAGRASVRLGAHASLRYTCTCGSASTSCRSSCSASDRSMAGGHGTHGCRVGSGRGLHDDVAHAHRREQPAEPRRVASLGEMERVADQTGRAVRRPGPPVLDRRQPVIGAAYATPSSSFQPASGHTSGSPIHATR